MDTDATTPEPTETGRTPSSEASTSKVFSRSELIEKYREQSVQKADPLAANLALINCDLMMFAQGNAELVSPPSLQEASPEALQRFERQANLQLRIVREIDRLARFDQQQNQGESQAKDGAKAKN